MEIFSKKFKKQFKKQFKIFLESFSYNLFNGGGVSLLGFIITQIFWIWLLIPFSSFLWNYMSYLGVTQFTEFDFKKVFWLVYASWFSIVVMIRLFFNYRVSYKEVNKNEKQM